MKNKFSFLFLLIIFASCTVEKNEEKNDQILMSRQVIGIETTSEFLSFKNNFSNYLHQLNTNPEYQEEKDLILSLDFEDIDNVNFNNFSDLKINQSILELKDLYTQYGIFTFSSSRIVNRNNEFQNFVIEDIHFDIVFDPNDYQAFGAPCEFGCINDAVSCSNTVNNTYNVLMKAAARQLYIGDAFGAAAIATYARIQQGIGQSNCANNLNVCVSNCH
jgi:SAM-dependent methyltransferase